MARYMSRDTEPLTKWRGLPIYLTTIFTALFVIGFLASAALAAARSPWMTSLTFHTPVTSWTGWLSVLSYPFIELPSFFTPLGIVCFYWWAAGIESHLGRGPLVRLLAILVLLPVAFMGVLALSGVSYGGLAGQFLITSGLLIAFATLYPNADWAGWVPFKYLAFACIVCGSLMLVAERNWLAVANLWLVCAASFFFVRHAIEQEYDDRVPLTARIRSWFRSKPKLRVVPRTRDAYAARTREDSDEDELDGEVDDLLEKIARNGLGSLTANERARLEQARENLLKKERK
jgi:hypothetical protein